MRNTWNGWSDSQLISKYSTDRDQAAYEELVRRGQQRGLGAAIETEFEAAVKRNEQARPFLAPVLLLAGVLLLSAFGCGKSRTVIGETKWIHGCMRYTIQPQELKDGKPIESQTFDAPQLVVVKKKAAATTGDGGGPRPEPKRR